MGETLLLLLLHVTHITVTQLLMLHISTTNRNTIHNKLQLQIFTVFKRTYYVRPVKTITVHQMAIEAQSSIYLASMSLHTCYSFVWANEHKLSISKYWLHWSSGKTKQQYTHTNKRYLLAFISLCNIIIFFVYYILHPGCYLLLLFYRHIFFSFKSSFIYGLCMPCLIASSLIPCFYLFI